MDTFKVVSYLPELSGEQADRVASSTAFLSFTRAITESEALNGLQREVIGYKVTEQGIVILLK